MKGQRKGNSFVQLNKIDNKGFSLVEVLVCVAILVIICVPLFSGFQYAAHNTKRAHSTQKITQYAQETMETVKSISIAELEAQIDAATDAEGNSNGSRSTTIDTGLQASFPTTYPAELFTIRTYEQSDVKVGGELYDMKVVLDPTKYSNAATTTAADANVHAVTDVEEIDGMLFPVIADEINSYEGAVGSGVLYNLLSKVRENQLASFGINEQARLQNIYANTVKTVMVTIKSVGSETTGTTPEGVSYVNSTIRVVCDLKYETNYAGITLQEFYNVYNGTFEVSGTVRNPGTSEEYIEWEKGGKVFIFAKAYKEQNSAFASLNLGANHVEIDNQYTGTGQLEVYLVRGCYGTNDTTTGIDDRRGMNFNTVKVNGSEYSSVPSMAVLTGQESYGNTLFRTNIKGAIASLPLTASDIAQTVGMEMPKMRCYEVLVEFTDADGKKVVSMTSTKLVDENP